MQGLILAAGMGKRLKFLTNNNTKCMVKVNGVTMIERALRILDKKGLSRIVIVVGYEGQKLIDYIGTPYGEELLRHSIELAHFKNIKVVAEGVESEKQLKVLRNLGCDTIQGYYYKPPMSYEEGVEYLSMLYVQNRV